MTTTPQASFLTGLIRVFALYFVLRAIDSAAGPIYTVILQYSVMPPEMADKFPRVWAMFLPFILIYLGIGVGAWFAAPFICPRTDSFPVEEGAGITWNESLIFCMGMALICWAVFRLVDLLVPFYFVLTADGSRQFSNKDMIQGLIAIVGLGSGFLLCGRFHSMHSWMIRRKQNASQDSGSR